MPRRSRSALQNRQETSIRSYSTRLCIDQRRRDFGDLSARHCDLRNLQVAAPAFVEVQSHPICLQAVEDALGLAVVGDLGDGLHDRNGWRPLPPIERKCSERYYGDSDTKPHQLSFAGTFFLLSYRKRSRARVGKGLQCEAHVRSMLESLFRVLRQTSRNHPLQTRGRSGRVLRDSRRIFLENGRHGFRRCLLAECWPPGHHLVENHAERKDVATSIGGSAAHLLRRHVTHGSQHMPRVGYLLHRRGRAAFACDRIELGQAEVEKLYSAIFGEEYVLRLEIAMNNSRSVGRRQALGDTAANVEHFAQRHRTMAEPLA